jgi:hypothetical protein
METRTGGNAMDLDRIEKPASVRHYGRGMCTVEATQEIKIEINGTEFMKAAVPPGKIWNVCVTVDAQESNA